MSEQNTPAGEASAPEHKKSKTGRWIVIGVVAVLLGGTGAAWIASHQEKTAEAAQARERGAQFTVHLESFTVNLADPEESHFLRITMDLGLDHVVAATEKDKEGPEAFPTARVRDAILSVLTLWKAEPLLTPEGKTKLKQDLLQTLQKKVPEIGVQDVYFTEFLVQR